MTNIGLRPSDDDIPIATIETFILNFDQDIYEKDVLLQVYAYIRGVKKFSGGLDEVRKQIDKDIQDVKSYMDEVVRKLGIWFENLLFITILNERDRRAKARLSLSVQTEDSAAALKDSGCILDKQGAF